MGIALAGVALPVYFVGPLLEALTGQWSTKYVPFLSNPLLWAQHLLIPWIALAFGYAALYARMTRAGMLDALNEDFVRTARAKGVRERKVLYKHALRSALTPLVTIFGMDLGTVLGGAVLLEVAFSLPGLGLLAVNSIQQDDFPVMMGVTLIAAFFIVVANIVVDVLYAVVDPRVRQS
jgi:peptide/nickel transport system permease protein